MQVWILSGVMILITSLIIMVIRVMVKNIGDKLDHIAQAVNELKELTATQAEQIKTLFSGHQDINNRINIYSDRIRELELTQASCTKRRYKQQ